jgi:hypothetical protein
MNYKSLSIDPFIAIACFALSVVACTNEKKPADNKTIHKPKTLQMITVQEIVEAQNVWGEGIVSIGNVFLAGGNYTKAAEDHIDALYGYNLGKVLFKPTLASENQFRLTKEGALSYFVGHNPKFAEDHGFAIRPWSKVRWERIGTHIEGNLAVAMGNYFFTPHDGGNEVKVEYTFGYTKDISGKLRIVLHGSHLPYTPN